MGFVGNNCMCWTWLSVTCAYDILRRLEPRKQSCGFRFWRQLLIRALTLHLKTWNGSCRVTRVDFQVPITRLERSRWRGGRFACYAPQVMLQGSAFSFDFCFSLIFLRLA